MVFQSNQPTKVKQPWEGYRKMLFLPFLAPWRGSKPGYQIKSNSCHHHATQSLWGGVWRWSSKVVMVFTHSSLLVRNLYLPQFLFSISFNFYFTFISLPARPAPSYLPSFLVYEGTAKQARGNKRKCYKIKVKGKEKRTENEGKTKEVIKCKEYKAKIKVFKHFLER